MAAGTPQSAVVLVVVRPVEALADLRGESVHLVRERDRILSGSATLTEDLPCSSVERPGAAQPALTRTPPPGPSGAASRTCRAAAWPSLRWSARGSRRRPS